MRAKQIVKVATVLLRFRNGVIGTIEDIPSIVETRAIDKVVVNLADARGKLPMEKLLEMRLGGVSFAAQVIGTLGGVVFATLGGTIVYGAIRMTVGLRIDQENEFNGADLSIHKITSTPERETVG